MREQGLTYSDYAALDDDNRYELVNVYQGDEPVHSPHVMCVRFSMAEIMANIPDIKNE